MTTDKRMGYYRGPCIFPALGYWEIGGKSVSSLDAKSGLNPDASWVPIDHSECCLQHRNLKG